MKTFCFRIIFTIAVLGSCYFSSAQPGEQRIQYPAGLKNAYFGVTIGYINYPFSSAQLEPGYTVQKISVPHVAPRLILFGYQFNKILSAQISYMRPVQWVSYKNINGDQTGHSVWMNVGGLTLAATLPLGNRFSLFGEAGLGMITRRGFEIDYKPVIKHATYATGLFGAALQYHLNQKWDLQLSSAWSPAHQKEKQPHTVFHGVGFNYHLKELSKKRIEVVQKAGYFFPRQLIQAGYTTNALGYGVNNLFSKTLPIFWGGAVHLRRGFSVNYQRNLFHSRKVFSLDVGTGAGFWKTRKNNTGFYTWSLYPVLRFIPIRSGQADVYFEYTVAGPTFISKTRLDDENTGRNFTFYDAMGIGMFGGKKKKFNAGIRIAHFSNGNIFPNNNGVKVPLSFQLGYSW